MGLEKLGLSVLRSWGFIQQYEDLVLGYPSSISLPISIIGRYLVIKNMSFPRRREPIYATLLQ